MSDRYKGFWSPNSSYNAGDSVTYYNVSGYGGDHAFYKLKSGKSAGPVRNNLGYNACPLKNFKWPVLSSGSRDLKLSADQNFDPTKGDQLDQAISEILSETTAWTQYKYYKVNVWDGPNGKDNALVVNDLYWEVYTPTPHTPENALTSTQTFSSTGMTTVSAGKYNIAQDADPASLDLWDATTTYASSNRVRHDDPDGTKKAWQAIGVPASTDIPGSSPDKWVDVTINSVLFDEVKDSEEGGELESDSYYISSVQNYRGYWRAAQNYKKFDIVRHRDSNKFYYARKGINSPSATEQVADLEFHIRPPVPNLTENHVGNLEFVSLAGKNGFRDAGFKSGQSIGITVDGVAKTYSIAMLTEKLIVLSMFQFGNREVKQVVESDLLESTLDTPQTQTVSIKTADLDDESWSSNSFFFDADYGSSVSFKGYNAEYEYGDGSKTVKPRGINSLSVDFNLKFTNRTSREANSILHFIENNLGQHEVQQKKYTLDYDQGIDGFNMDGDALFFPYNNTENLTRSFYCFDFSHTIEGEDVHTVNAKVFNNNTSILHQNDYLYTNRPEIYDKEQTYSKHDIVYAPDSDAYYYYQGEENARGDPPTALLGISINKDKWTREFYWKPSTSFNINHSPSISELSSKTSAYKQYFPRNKNNVNLLEFTVTFAHRSEREAYAILHFLESHLAYKSFLFIPPAPYNRKRRFICQEWEHTYVFRDSHTITAKFEQYSLGQNTPLDDDEMDALAPVVGNHSARLSLIAPVALKSSAEGVFTLKHQVKLKNTGETEAKDIVLTLDTDTLSKGFSITDLAFNREDGAYLDTYSGLSRKTNTANYDNSEGGGFLYKEAGDIKSQDNLGRIGTLDFTVGEERLKDRINPVAGTTHVSKDFLNPSRNDSLRPGESAFAEIYYPTALGEKGEVLGVLEAAYVSGETLPTSSPDFTEGKIYTIASVNNGIGGADTDFTVFGSPSNTIGQVFTATAGAQGGTGTANLTKITKYEISANVAQDHVAQEVIRIPVVGTADTASLYKKKYLIDSYSDFHFISEDNISEVIEHSAILQGYEVAEPQVIGEIADMLDQNGLEGKLALGITYDSGWKYNSTGSAVGGWVSIAGVPGDILVLDVASDRKSYTFDRVPSTGVVDGAIFEKTETDTLKNINLMELLLRSLSEQGLLDVKEVNFDVSGVILSESTELAAIDSGSGYLPGMHIKINLDASTKVIGRGGKGGVGMVSEGKMFQGDGSYDSMQDLRPPSSGEDGGDAIEISEQNSNIKFTITWATGAKVFGGGGGGGGGGAFIPLANEWPGDSGYKMNFAGSGGGGAGMGAAGPTLAEFGTLEAGGSGGKAVNNYSHIALRGGSDGGAPGKDGDGRDWPLGIAHDEILNVTNTTAIYLAMTGSTADTGGINWWAGQGANSGSTTDLLVTAFLGVPSSIAYRAANIRFPSSGGKAGKAILYYGHVEAESLILSGNTATNTKGEIGKHG